MVRRADYLGTAKRWMRFAYPPYKYEQVRASTIRPAQSKGQRPSVCFVFEFSWGQSKVPWMVRRAEYLAQQNGGCASLIHPTRSKANV